LLRRFVLGKKLYVGNLGYGVSSSDLEQLFAAFGTVQSAEVIADRDNGRSKGFGFVEMSTDQEAQAAIQGLSGLARSGPAEAGDEVAVAAATAAVAVAAEDGAAVTERWP
jgi:RNA recognition motif-containing protein